MNEYIASRRHTSRLCGGSVLRIRIRNMNGLIKLAVRVAPIQHIGTFRSLMISLLPLGPDRIAAQRNLIRLDHVPLAEQFECPLFLEYHYAVRMQRRLRGTLPNRQPALHPQRKRSNKPDSHRNDYRGIKPATMLR